MQPVDDRMKRHFKICLYVQCQDLGMLCSGRPNIYFDVIGHAGPVGLSSRVATLEADKTCSAAAVFLLWD